MQPVDATLDPVELVLECGVVRLCRRRDVRAEEADAEATVAANRREAVALVQRARDRPPPVDADVELSRGQLPFTAARAEHDGAGGYGTRAALELLPCLDRRQSADADPCDLDPRRDTRGRAGERESEDDDHDGDRRDRNCGALQQKASL